MRVDTVFQKCSDSDRFHFALDSIWHTDGYEKEKHSFEPSNCCVFRGNLKNGEPYDGKLFCYDQDGIIEKMEIWKAPVEK